MGLLTTPAIRDEQIDDLLACLYGLHTLLSLHFIQEEENFFVLLAATEHGAPVDNDCLAL